jgi:peptidyl-prolyl cis-trans isomerase SurA
MANTAEPGRLSSKFRMQDLPTEVARVVDTLQVDQISAPFEMINSKGKTVVVIAKLKSRTEGHRATITEDFQVMKNVVLAQRRQEHLLGWVKEKLRDTYVWMNPRYCDCDFEYEGWIK